MRKINTIILHCSASDNHNQTAEMIDRWHKERGWHKIGYHYFIRFNGMCEVGRREGEVGSHVYKHNANSIGICLAGLTAKNFTEQQFEALEELLRDLKVRYPKAKLVGHRELNPHKTCPVFDYQGFKEDWDLGFQPRPEKLPWWKQIVQLVITIFQNRKGTK